jgi:thiol-disulfide isomerase/thioredoxin
MNILKATCLSLALACLFSAGCSPVTISSYEDKEALRAYVSTRLALAVMTTPDSPDEEDEDTELCDGSGWITHGDGHKTKCPGCSACEKKDGQQPMASEMEPDYYVYHFGAKWCAPCQKLKKQVWENEEIKAFLKDKKVKLWKFDADDPEHAAFFKYYKISSYPTVILLDKDKLSDIMLKTNGYKDKDSMKKLINEKIPSSVLEI